MGEKYGDIRLRLSKIAYNDQHIQVIYVQKVFHSTWSKLNIFIVYIYINMFSYDFFVLKNAN